MQNPRSVPQDTQQKTFKFVKSPKGEINFRAPLGIPAPSLDRQNKCFLQFRYQTNFPCHHQKLDRSSTPKPLRSRTSFLSRALQAPSSHMYIWCSVSASIDKKFFKWGVYKEGLTLHYFFLRTWEIFCRVVEITDTRYFWRLYCPDLR